MRRSPLYLQAPIDDPEELVDPDPDCHYCGGKGYVSWTDAMESGDWHECPLCVGDGFDDPEDREADRACRRYHQMVDEGEC